MFTRLGDSLRSLMRQRRQEGLTANFDPVWYRSRYPDLAHLNGVSAVRRHYLDHGLREGRYPNAAAEEAALVVAYSRPSAEFNLAAYRMRNPDLAGLFSDDRDLILHYIRNGRAEGRPAIFEGSIGETEAWTVMFSAAHYAAWIGAGESGTAADRAFASREEAIAHFRRHGIAALAPIHFDFLFDPIFYREEYGDAVADDVRLYRRWLEHGLPTGQFANEAQALLPLIGRSAYPQEFDWRGYARLRAVDPPTRSAALRFLIEQEQDWPAALPFVGAAWPLILEHVLRNCLSRDRLDRAHAARRAFPDSQAEWPSSLHALDAARLAKSGSHGDVLAACNKAIARGDRSLPTLERAVQAAVELGDRTTALGLLGAAHEQWIGSVRFEMLCDRTIDALHAAACAQARAQFASCRAGVAEMQLERALDEIARAVADLRVRPAGLPADADSPVVVLDGARVPAGTSAFEGNFPDELLAAAGFPVVRYQLDKLEQFFGDLLGARAAVFCDLPATPDVMRAILLARAMGVATFYRPSDPRTDSAPTGSPDHALHAVLSRCALSLCDQVLAHTVGLLSALAPVTQGASGLVVPRRLDREQRDLVAAGTRLRGDGDRTRIFCAIPPAIAKRGEHLAQATESDRLGTALAQLFADRADVDLVFPESVDLPADLARLRAQILRYDAAAESPGFTAVLAACDIALLWPVADAKGEAWSEAIWQSAAAAAVPIVAAENVTLRAVIDPGRTGFLLKPDASWPALLGDLCDQSLKRRLVGEAARKELLRQQSTKAVARSLAAALMPLVPPPAPAQKLRIMIVNVFFAPQSIGGATRVVEDNVTDLAAEGDFEIAVFCSDDGRPWTEAVRTSRFGDVPVFRAAQPPHGDAIADDDAILPAFRRALDLFRPDLVHFHCLQRLTAAPLRMCRDAGLPYIVTLHDGWWLSQDQFLVDRDGFLHIPGSDLLKTSAGDQVISANDVQRRAVLSQLLSGAAGVFAVSESFASLYRSAGVCGVRVLANGLPSLASATPALPVDGRLRLAHIGGRTPHKGAHLVEAALRRGHFANLCLLMIDGSLGPDECVHEQWGATSVVLRGPCPQDLVADLYAQIDVVLAPSLWPESYGLVAREATHFGCWVVASRLGAMGEEVRPGETGYLVDTRSGQELNAVLAQLDAAVAEHRRGLIRNCPSRVRQASDQARELAGIYREFIARAAAARSGAAAAVLA